MTIRAYFLPLSLALMMSGCTTRRPEPQFPGEVPLVTRVEWGARPPVLPVREHTPTRLTIHHTGTAQNPNRSLEDKLRGLQAFSQRDDSLASGAKKPAWPDVPYHYYVSTDGRVGEGREWRYVGDTNTSYDPTGHLLLVVEGSFDQDSLTTAQRRTLEVLVPSLARSFGIPAERLASHKDFASTDCPGKALYDLLPHYRALIAGTAAPEPPDMPVTHAYADLSEVRLHYASVGAGDLIMFVHGFPEFWYAWRNQLAEFGKDHRAVAIDLRGYSLSSKPASVDQYAMIHLVQDLAELADKLGHEKFTLVAHDWGGVIAWSFAMAYPERLEKLVIINAPHPAIFQRELANNPAQQKASAYIQLFRTPAAESTLSANNFAALSSIVLAPGLQAGYFNAADRKAYLEAWAQPGALTGGLNYYRALRPAGPGSVGGAAPTAALPPKISVPTLVIWGERDHALLTGNLDGLDQYVSNLTVRRIPDGSHWVVHEKPALVNRYIREFMR